VIHCHFLRTLLSALRDCCSLCLHGYIKLFSIICDASRDSRMGCNHRFCINKIERHDIEYHEKAVLKKFKSTMKFNSPNITSLSDGKETAA